jgi:hypothetical protein
MRALERGLAPLLPEFIVHSRLDVGPQIKNLHVYEG